MKILKPIKGYRRIPTGSSLQNRIRREVERTAHKFNCSKSFVIEVALAKAMKIHINYDYED